MDWMQQLGGVLQRYGNGDGDHTQAESDFDHVARTAPTDVVSSGLADAFRSDQTPPFGSMLSQMFGHSAGAQRATVLNTLLATVGPMVMTRVLAQHGSAISSHIQPGQPVSPAVADQVPPDAVQALAHEAEQKDPSIVDRISQVYSNQPALIKKLGGMALVVAMAKIAQSQGRGR
jgi:hypothetical protein